MTRWIVVLVTGLVALPPAIAQDASVKPGINKAFENPNPAEFVEKFEIESREVFARREEIVAACGIRPGMTVADVGAGTGLFTRMFSEKVGPEGRVIAVDITEKFLDHIQARSRELRQRNVETRLGTLDSTKLPPASVDLVFICDTYHHFEFPRKTMESVRQALKPGGRVVLVDFHRIEGQSSDWTLSHVRAGRDVFEREICETGFRKTDRTLDVLRENYLTTFVVAESAAAGAGTAVSAATLEYPMIAGFGGVGRVEGGVETPRAGAKVVFDVTVDAKPGDVSKGLERAARLLNLYGQAGLSYRDVRIAVVLHGEATKSVLADAAYAGRFGNDRNPNLPLIRLLQEHGVEVTVCGQALNYKGFSRNDVAPDIPVAVAALTVIINKQVDGHAYLPVH